MLVVVSPAKKLNMKPIEGISSTEPYFYENVGELIDITRALNIDEIKNLMGISSNLAQLNMKRFSLFGKQQKKTSSVSFCGRYI